MLNIIEGKEKRALKIVIYGAEGIGKSSLAAGFPYPLFIDTEGGTSNLNIRRIKCNKSWSELLGIVKEVQEQPSICRTLVVDTADWAEILCERYICEKYRKDSLESFGFGKGYTYLQETFSQLLIQLDNLIELGVNVVVTAHAKPRKYELPEEAGAFDKWEMKLTRQVAPLLKEWCDALFFCNYKVFVVSTESGSKKAQGGKRVMYTSHTPTYDAKNRFDLPDELDLSFDSIKHLFAEQEPTQAVTRANAPKVRPMLVKLKTLVNESGVTLEDVQKVVAEKGHYDITATAEDYADDFIARWIIPNWKKIIERINENKGEN